MQEAWKRVDFAGGSCEVVQLKIKINQNPKKNPRKLKIAIFGLARPIPVLKLSPTHFLEALGSSYCHENVAGAGL